MLGRLIMRKPPQSLGDGMNRVRRAFHAFGDDVLKTPGARQFRTPFGNFVGIYCNPNGIEVYKVLSGAMVMDNPQMYNRSIAALTRHRTKNSVRETGMEVFDAQKGKYPITVPVQSIVRRLSDLFHPRRWPLYKII